MSNLQQATHFLLSKLAALETSLQPEHPTYAKLAGWVHEGLTAIPIEILYFVIMFTAATVLLLFVIAPIAGFSTYVERRVAARMQARIGCNRVGPEGLFQFLADGVKLILKEDLMPTGADAVLFKMAPFLVIAGAFLSFVCIPFGKYLIVADLDVGLFYLMAVSSIVVVGILLAGWASNNKWALLGAMRSAAQIVSYEIPVALTLMIPVLLVGSLSLQEINRAQAGGVFNWLIFWAFPAPLIAFVVHYIASLAEVNRTPFDLPEAESELVAGYATEYSGIRWGLFFVGEYANMFLIGAVSATCFLGGWQKSIANGPFVAGALFFAMFFAVKSLSYVKQLIPALLSGKRLIDLLHTVRPIRFRKWGYILIGIFSLIAAAGMHLLYDFWLIQFLTFSAKAYSLVIVMIWIRWTLPRYRIDQMMALCWKKLVPISFGCVAYTAIMMVVLR